MENLTDTMKADALKAGEKYGLDPMAIQDEVRRQLTQKIAEEMVKKVTAGNAGLIW